MTVSIASMGFMVFSAALSIGVPVGLFLVLRRKMGAKAVPMLVGAAAFILFALVLESIVHQLVLRPGPTGAIALRSRPVLYMLYGGFMAGLFEESARYVSFLLLRRRYSGLQTALSYGVGHGGIEAVVFGGLGAVSNLALSVMINTGAVDAMKAAMPPEALTAFGAQLSALTSTQPFLFAVAGLERMIALTLHIALSVLVFYAATNRRAIWLFPAAIVLHAVADFPAALMQAGAIASVALVEGLCALAALICAVLAAAAHRRFRLASPAEPEPAAEHP